MITNVQSPSLVTRFPEIGDLLTSVATFHSGHSCSSSAAQIPRTICAAYPDGHKGTRDPVVVYRDGPFNFVPATSSQPLRIAFRDADREFGLSCIVESMRGGNGPAVADPHSISLYKYAARVARSDANVMITGKSDAGKEGMSVDNEGLSA
tara:strand:+ start:18277 stop:18729 length:453 start_codon:yes stop_codon:yes gene_type:complete